MSGGAIGMGNLIRISSPRGPDRARTSPSERTAANGDPRAGRYWEGGVERDRLEGDDTMLDQLDRRERLRLVEFVCSFAWADLEVRPEERAFISRLIRRLGLDDEEDLQVQQWLERPPSADEVDPTAIPPEHRRLFVESIEGLIASDGEIAEEETESLEVFKQLLVG